MRKQELFPQAGSLHCPSCFSDLQPQLPQNGLFLVYISVLLCPCMCFELQKALGVIRPAMIAGNPSDTVLCSSSLPSPGAFPRASQKRHPQDPDETSQMLSYTLRMLCTKFGQRSVHLQGSSTEILGSKKKLEKNRNLEKQWLKEWKEMEK